MKRLLGISLIFALASCVLGVVSASAEKAAPSGKKIKVFIMSGQSGMAGFGNSTKLPDALRIGNDREDAEYRPPRGRVAGGAAVIAVFWFFSTYVTLSVARECALAPSII